MDVKGHCQIIRALFLQDFEKNIQKAIHPIGVKAFAVGKIGHSVKRPVQNTVSVDQYEFLHDSNHAFPSPAGFEPQAQICVFLFPGGF